MNKIIHLSLARKSVPVFMDVVQSATEPAITFVLDDYEPPANATARLYILKEGGEVYNNCTLLNNQATFSPSAGSFDVPGNCVAQLQILQGSKVAVSYRIFVRVEPNLILGSAARASTEFDALTALIQDAQKYDNVIYTNNVTGVEARAGWTALAEGQDLNEIKDVGYYYTQTVAICNSLANCPVTGTTIRMRVEYTQNNSSLKRQIVEATGINYQDRVFRRSTADNGATWGEWFAFANRADFGTVRDMARASNVMGADSAAGWKVISTAAGNLDLNTITEFGTYYCNSSTTAESCLNRPPIDASVFKLEVLGHVPNANKEFVYIMQRYYTANFLWTRLSSDRGETWSAWTSKYVNAVRLSDLNNVAQTGLFYYDSSAENKPTGTTLSGTGLYVQSATGYGTQIVAPNGTVTPPKLFIRKKYNGTWSDYFKIVVEAVDAGKSATPDSNSKSAPKNDVEKETV